MALTKTQAVLAVAISLVAVLGYVTDAANYYEPTTRAVAAHASIRSWNELESIKHQIEVLKLKIQRLTDRAMLQNRPLSVEEQQEIEFLREEIRLHNDRRNAILSERK